MIFRMKTTQPFQVAMAYTVTLFQSVIEYFQSMGIFPTQPNQRYSVNYMSVLILLSMLVIFVPSSAFFFFRAETREEFYTTIYISLTVLTYVGCFIVNIWKMIKVRELITRSENFIAKSKLHSFKKERQYRLWFQYNSSVGRSGKCGFMEQLYSIKCTNRANIQGFVLSCNKICTDWINVAQPANNSGQLFHLWFGRRVILLVLPSIVSTICRRRNVFVK